MVLNLVIAGSGRDSGLVLKMHAWVKLSLENANLGAKGMEAAAAQKIYRKRARDL